VTTNERFNYFQTKCVNISICFSLSELKLKTDVETMTSTKPSSIPTEGEVLRLVAANYLRVKPFDCKADCDEFLTYMKEMQVIITDVSIESLLITVRCDSLQILERLWERYTSGHLGKVIQRSFVTEKVLAEFSLAELKLKTTISEDEYKTCKAHLKKDLSKG